MNILRPVLTAALIWIACLSPASAQDDDKGFLTRTIQDALSGAGRTVSIEGFTGALSSAASFSSMTIADKDGVWLSLEDVVLDWNRSALLRGRLEVEKLTARKLDIPRLPISEEETLPDAEATPFSLPELPVSIEIEDFAVEEINLGAPLLGEDVQLVVRAKAKLTDDEGNIDFTATRTDGKAGEFAIKADFERSDAILSLLLELKEEEAGIAARLLNLPGQPSVDMTIQGQGPLDDFTTDVKIATNGEDRLAGQIVLGAQESESGADGADRRIQANIGGDITALLAPQYREFFGNDVRLTIDALRAATGAIDVSDFAIKAQAVDLEGKVALNAESWPTFIDISGTIANPDGTRIQLPVGGQGTTVERVGLRVDYDADDGEAFNADFDITALSMTGLEIASTKLGLDGTLQGNLGSVGQFLGDMVFEADGLELTDGASAEAIGQKITGKANLNYIEGQPMRISDLDLTGADYGLAGSIIINGLEQSFLTRLNATLKAEDLSRFSALAGRELDGATDLALKGTVTPLSGAFDLTASGSAQDLRTGIAQADAVMAGTTTLSMQAVRDETGTFLRDLVLLNDALLFSGEAELRTDDSRVQAQFRLNDLSVVVPQYSGAISVQATAVQDAIGWTVDAATEGPYGAALTAKGLATGANAAIEFTADVPDARPFAEPFGQDIDGPIKATGELRQSTEGWLLVTDATGPYGVALQADGLIAPKIDMNIDASVPEISLLVPQVSGAVQATGRVRQEDQGFFVDLKTNGPYGATAMVEGLATGPDMTLTFDVAVPDVNPLVPQINGAVAAKGVVRQTPDGISINTNATGPYGARAAVEGIATGPNMSLTFDVAVANVAPLVPGASGGATAKGVLRQTPDGIAIDTNATGPFASRASVQGVVTGPNAAVDFNVAVANLGALVEKVNGPLEVIGSARKQGTAWRIDTNANGPSGTQATVAGLVNENGNLDIDINGSAPLGLSRPFLAPRDLQGLARFDLSIDGPAALSSVSGSIRASDASLTAPNLRAAIRGIDANIQLGGNRATVDITGAPVDGGRLRIGGGVTLTGAFPADLSIALQDVVLTDPRLYRTSLSGNLRVAGPLTGGARISGQVNVGETVVNVPSTGLTSIGDIPQITHVGASRPGVVTTRNKAGLSGADAGSDPAAGSSGPGFGLDLQINAPNRIFVRGRGLDAELGGALTLTGNTNQIISAGRFELVRGRLSILGKRFDLREGSIQFLGDFVPYLRFVSATDTEAGEVRVVVEGPADAPEVSFESTPDAPQDEVLAQLLFGRNISEISAFQALQLASAVATLAGKGGNGIIGNLRDGFGLDDLDVTTTDDGATALRLGKYLSDNVYTDVTATSDGTADVSLNIDITPSLVGKATLGSDGNSSLGLFFERDY